MDAQGRSIDKFIAFFHSESLLVLNTKALISSLSTASEQ